MRVLYINHTILKSGAAISLGTLITSLNTAVTPCFLLRKGSTVDEILGATGSRLKFHARWVAFYQTTIYGKPASLFCFFSQIAKTPLAIGRAALISRKWRCDVVHINETTLPADAIGAALAGRPVIIHARTALNRNHFERGLLSFLTTFSKIGFVAIDDEVKATLPSRCRAKCTVIHNPVQLGPPPTSESIASKRKSWGLNAEHVIVGQLGSLHREKGVWDILAIARLLCPVHPNLRFVLVGDTSPQAGEGPALKKFIESQPLFGKVILPGYDTDLAATYGSIDVALCLFGAGLGGVGRAAYEAAIAGRPLVATLPGARTSKTLIHEKHGLLFDPSDLAGVREAIERLVVSPSLRDQLGHSAQSEIGKRHDPAIVAEKMLALYKETLGLS